LDKISMGKIAKSLNISKNTVSKAINNKGGVSYSTKKKILELAKKEGYVFEEPFAHLGVVMPASPRNFWNSYLSNIQKRSEQLGLVCRNFLYENSAHPEEVLWCLECAEKAGVKVLIVGITCSVGIPQIMDKVKELDNKMFVLFVHEIYRDDHQFYVGEHSYESARKLTATYLSKHPESKNFLVFSKGGHSIVSRVDGFRDELTLRGLKVVDVLKFPESSTAMAAKVARILEKYKDDIDCIFCASDSVSDTCLAIRKLKQDIHCIGFDCTTSDMTYFDMGILKCVARQNIPAQAKTVVDAAYHCITYGKKPKPNHLYVEDYFISG